MPGQASAKRRQPLLMEEEAATDGKSGGRWSHLGGTAGECAALCCCCPCGVMHLLILAVCRIPAGIWRRMRRNRLLRKKRKILSDEKENGMRRNFSVGFYMNDEEAVEEDAAAAAGKIDGGEWENEMWERFYSAGFWRSHSERYD